MNLLSIFNILPLLVAAAGLRGANSVLCGANFVSRLFETTRRPLVLIDRVFPIAPFLSSSGSSFDV